MKMSVVLFLILLAVTGCQSDSDDEVADLLSDSSEERWELVKSISGWTNEVQEGDALTYRDFYVFNDDSTFVKSNTEGDTVTGTYRHVTTEEERLALELTFPRSSVLRNSCIAEQEYIFIQGNSLINDVRPCDGPQLFYAKRLKPTEVD